MSTCAECATSTPFDGDEVSLRGSGQPFLGATSPPPPSFFSLDTSVFSSDNNCNECDDFSLSSEFPMCAVGTDCGDYGVRTVSPPPPPYFLCYGLHEELPHRRWLLVQRR